MQELQIGGDRADAATGLGGIVGSRAREHVS
jgi:hypothetical protein